MMLLTSFVYTEKLAVKTVLMCILRAFFSAVYATVWYSFSAVLVTEVIKS